LISAPCGGAVQGFALTAAAIASGIWKPMSMPPPAAAGDLEEMTAGDADRTHFGATLPAIRAAA
jgi:hypothetical protein